MTTIGESQTYIPPAPSLNTPAMTNKQSYASSCLESFFFSMNSHSDNPDLKGKWSKVILCTDEEALQKYNNIFKAHPFSKQTITVPEKYEESVEELILNSSNEIRNLTSHQQADILSFLKNHCLSHAYRNPAGSVDCKFKIEKDTHVLTVKNFSQEDRTDLKTPFSENRAEIRDIISKIESSPEKDHDKIQTTWNKTIHASNANGGSPHKIDYVIGLYHFANKTLEFNGKNTKTVTDVNKSSYSVESINTSMSYQECSDDFLKSREANETIPLDFQAVIPSVLQFGMTPSLRAFAVTFFGNYMSTGYSFKKVPVDPTA